MAANDCGLEICMPLLENAARQRELVGLGLGIAGLLAAAATFFGVSDLASHRALKEVFVWFLVLGLTALFLRGHRLLQASALAHSRTIYWFGMLFGLIAICIPPFDTTD